MKLSPVIILFVVSAARLASAQTATPEILAQTASPLIPHETPTLAPPAPAPTSDPAAVPAVTQLFQPAAPSFLKSLGRDVTGFFSTDTARIVGMFAVAGLTARPADRPAARDAGEWLSKGTASIGNWGGNLQMQLAGGVATYVIGRSTANPKLASLGGDLIRGQLLSQAFVQGTKFAVGRQRPDGSNSLSFPSGHTASAFTTATVLQQHYGWKLGVPAYAFAGFVGASRMASNKHYLSDVLVGAGVGVAVGRTVTLHLGREQFAIGAAPTRGGAMVTFTKR
jgi:membrane-associated phospholipid phosphatase